MRHQYVTLVENTLSSIHEVDTDELNPEQQVFLFTGWLLGKTGDDKNYSNNDITDVVADFKDDMLPKYTDDHFTIELSVFSDKLSELVSEPEEEPKDVEDTSDEEGADEPKDVEDTSDELPDDSESEDDEDNTVESNSWNSDIK